MHSINTDACSIRMIIQGCPHSLSDEFVEVTKADRGRNGEHIFDKLELGPSITSKGKDFEKKTSLTEKFPPDPQ